MALCLVRLAERWRGRWFGLSGRLLSLVREQEGQRAKALAAPLTLIWPLSRVKANVCQQPGLLGERLVAVGALEGLLPRVEPAVGLQMGGSAEGLPTIRAFEGPVSAVDYLVCHQVGGLMEVLATGAAPELPLLVVRGEVEGEVGRGDEGLGAQAAAVGVEGRSAVGPPAVGGAAARLAGWAFGGFLCLLFGGVAGLWVGV